MRIWAIAFVMSAIAWLTFTPIASGQSPEATPRAQPTLINGGNRPPFYGEMAVGRHLIRSDSPECGRAIEVAIREGHPDPSMPVPTAFCQKELDRAMAALKELPAKTSVSVIPAPRDTPPPPGQ